MYKVKFVVYGLAVSLLGGSCTSDAREYTHEKYHNIAFINDSDKTLYVYSDKEFQDEVPPRNSRCFGFEFFKGQHGTTFRYLKAYHVKPVTFTEEPVIKYLLKPNKNYYATTQTLQEVNDEWPDRCVAPKIELVALGNGQFTIGRVPYTITVDPQTNLITIKDKTGKVTSSFKTSLFSPSRNLEVADNRLRVYSTVYLKYEVYNVDNPSRPSLQQREMYEGQKRT